MTDTIQLKCIYGNKVKLLNLRTQEVTEYKLVTFSEERLSLNEISNYTEIGKAIWAKSTGEEVSIEIPQRGVDKYRIINIENAS